MRFAAVVVFAGAALASQKGGEGEGDQYTTVTDVKTVSSCAPEVADCTWAHKTSSKAWPETTSTSAPETWKTPGTKPPVSTSESWPSKSKSGSWEAPKSPTTSSAWSKPTGGNWGNGSTTLTTSKSSPTGTWPAGTWDDCECDEEDTCSSAGTASPTGSWSGSTGSSSPVGGGSGSGNGSVSTSSPTGVVTAGAGAAGPAFLAIVAGLVAFLA